VKNRKKKDQHKDTKARRKESSKEPVTSIQGKEGKKKKISNVEVKEKGSTQRHEVHGERHKDF
jgi:hypothetical protein